ncbi:19939_t:CDS:10 [Funneliformis geosporum]|uniref:8299_t:CDS:1 n=1 Tax=Funneliformis geosporum TaxID=1117311 RepID=A0A9W4WKA0_9GLOM|nr:19939_t:CDS:10 [Funneliformis geosporum]CAI2167857.1 8299_t:CDS:10 [Funneliformis geosporum]
MTDKTNARPIRRLDETVVNRIAAGEIIHRPANALKELIENCLDAGATNIQITIKDGGLKLLQILDNGHGIRREDMSIVCERFTTSKLKKFEDLSNISTYGFRGEALASISHVAHVTITTKTADSNCAYRACYSDGKLVPAKPGTSAEPKACAGNTGTQITAEDVFYNVPTRRKALKNPSDEYNRILDVVNRYAIHNSGVSFTCKKQGSNQADVNTLSTSSTLDNIRHIYGNVASELIELGKSFRKLEFKVNGYISNANYNLKKMNFLLFINHRAVENSSLKKTIESIYATYLPKSTHPYVYLSLEINPQNVDVNVHPTKREVSFLNEDEVIAAIGDTIQERLADANSSRVFLTQTLLPGAKVIEANMNQVESSIKKSGIKVSNYKLVRTDSRVQTLDNFLNPDDMVNKQLEDNSRKEQYKPTHSSNSSKVTSNSNIVGGKRKRERFEVRLTSILTLRKRIKEVEHKEFHNFGLIHLSLPAPIRELIIFALESCDRDEIEDLKSNEEIAQNGELTTLPLMLKGYAPNLDKLPTFLLRLGTEVDWETETGCFDTLARELGLFYATEPPNFSIISTSVSDKDDISTDDMSASNINKNASISSPRRKNSEKVTNLIFTEQQKKAEIARYKWQVEHLIFPILKSQFIAPKSAAENGHVLQIANLPDLYRIFERC